MPFLCLPRLSLSRIPVLFRSLNYATTEYLHNRVAKKAYLLPLHWIHSRFFADISLDLGRDIDTFEPNKRARFERQKDVSCLRYDL